LAESIVGVWVAKKKVRSRDITIRVIVVDMEPHPENAMVIKTHPLSLDLSDMVECHSERAVASLDDHRWGRKKVSVLFCLPEN
jgi:hypothetical protein